MLSLRLRAEDLAVTWRSDAQGWSAGESYIRPFAHRALETLAYTTHGRWLFAVRERLLCEAAPMDDLRGRALQQVDDRQWAALRADLLEHPLDYLLLEIDRRTEPVVTLQSGLWGTAPVYLVQQGDTLWGDWHPASLYRHRPDSSVHLQLAAGFLAGNGPPYASETLFPGMRQLTERAVATWSLRDGRLACQYPEPVARMGPSPLNADADVPGAFARILGASIARRIDPNRPAVAVGLSGGLDSAVVAVVAQSYGASPVQTFGLIMPGANGVAQQVRRDDLVQRFGFDDQALLASQFPPFGSLEDRLQGRAMVPWQEYYDEAFRALLRQARASGQDMLFSGVGGDELFVRYRSELTPAEQARARESADPAARQLPVYLTALAREACEAPLAAPFKAPRGYMDSSCLESSAAVSALYLSEGVWPVNPLCTPELVRFCGRIPFEWRDGKHLERHLLAAHGAPRTVTHPVETETFAPLMDLGLRFAGREAIRELFREPRLADLGLLDRDRFLSAFAAYCEEPVEGEEQHWLYSAVALELSLRSLP